MITEWYSFKIPEYSQLKTLDPIAQCAGQVHYIDKAVSQGISQAAESRKLVVHYEEFCSNPGKVFEELTAKMNSTDTHYTGPDQFMPSRIMEADDQDLIYQSFKAFDSQA